MISKVPGTGTRARKLKVAVAKCPICGKPAATDYRPFCSKRCADIDLSRWLEGRYVVPGDPIGKASDEDEGG